MSLYLIGRKLELLIVCVSEHFHFYSKYEI
jgi:hypothetical protein